MKTFRITDLIVQSALIIFAIFQGIKSMTGQPELFFYSYFIIGGWQIFSMLIHHFFAKPTSFHQMRTIYAKTCLTLLLIGVITGVLLMIESAFGFLIVLYGYGLLWFTPLLAFFYLYICQKEYSQMIKKELVHLK